jgi:hypothetical protein
MSKLVGTKPMSSETEVQRGLDLGLEDSFKISPANQRLVQRAVAMARDRTLQSFTLGVWVRNWTVLKAVSLVCLRRFLKNSRRKA